VLWDAGQRVTGEGSGGSQVRATPTSAVLARTYLEAVPEPASGESRIADYSPFGRVVFPVALLDSGDFRQA